MLALLKQHNLKNAEFCENCFVKIPVLYTRLTNKMMSSVLGMGWSTNSIARKLAKYAKFITRELKLRNNWQNGDSLINNYDAETNTSLAEKSRMFVNTTSKAALTTANWIRILTETT